MAQIVRWTYKMTNLSGWRSALTTQWLNEQGNEGWELVTAEYDPTDEHWHCIFKRPA